MCGIYGFCGNQPPNEDKIKILAMYNLARGDDSCGIFWDGKVVKGVKAEANVFRMFEKNVFKPVEKYWQVIGHNRKSTIGANTEANCHPFEYFQPDKKECEIAYAVGAHNGTIKNREELRTKYKIKEHAVDSCEILNILVNSKTDVANIEVLEDYEGYGAFVWTYPKTNEIFIFRGKSAQGETTDGERPLYYWKKEGEDQIYFSSIKESLLMICDDAIKTINEFAPNKIHIINKGKIRTLKREFNRAERNKIETYTTNNFSHSARHTAVHTPPYKYDIKTEDIFISYPKSAIEKFDKKNPKRESMGKTLLETEPYIDLQELIKLTGDKRIGGKIMYCGGRYMRNGHMLGGKLKHGEAVTIDKEGRPFTHPDYDATSAKQYFFWNGWTCKDQASLESVIDMYKRGILFKDNPIVPNELNIGKLLRYFTGILFSEGKLGGWCQMADCDKLEYNCYTGSWSPLFNQGKTYHFSNGFFDKVQLTLSAPKLEEEIEEGKTENSEREDIEEVLKDTMDFIDIAKADLETFEIKHTSNENSRVKILGWLSQSYEYLFDHWKHITKEEKEENLIY